MSAWTVIAHTEVGSGGAADITFMNVGNIPNTYTDLVILASLRQNTRNSPNGGMVYRAVINGSTANSSMRSLRGDGSVTLSQTDTNILFIGGSSSDTSSTFGNSIIYIPNYAGNTAKSISVDGVNETNATAAYPHIIAGLWNSTSAITSIKLEGLFGDALVQYSSATLYGITKGSSGGVVVS